MPQHKQVACFGKQNSYCDMRRTEAAERLHGKWLCKAQGNTNNNNKKKTGLVNSWITIQAHSTSIIRRRPSGWGFGSFPYIPLWRAVSWRLERLFIHHQGCADDASDQKKKTVCVSVSAPTRSPSHLTDLSPCVQMFCFVAFLQPAVTALSQRLCFNSP